MKERIDILYECSVLCKEVAEFMYEIIEYFKDGDYSEEKLEVFITHLAMASQRVFNNEECMNFEDAIWNDVVNNSAYEKSLEIYTHIKNVSPVEYPLSEEKFILLHLCNLMSA